MRTRSRGKNDSLELLLDTICNLFGGIIFIAILVVVLVRASGERAEQEPQERVSAAQLIEQETELLAARRRIESLQRADEQRKRLLAQFAPEESAAALEQLEQAERRRRDLQARRDEALARIAKNDAEALKRQADVERMEKEATEVERSLANILIEIERERKDRTIQATLPIVRPRTKEGIPVIVRFNRFYVWHRYDATGTRLGLNMDDFMVLGEHKGAILTAPNPTAGVPLTVRPEDNLTALRRRLAGLPPDRFFLDVAFRADSYGVCTAMRAAAAQLGYEVSLLPLDADSLVADRGGADRGVQ